MKQPATVESESRDLVRYSPIVHEARQDSNFVIFSSNKPAHEVMSFLVDNGIQFKILLGAYKGIRETSYLVASVMMPKVFASGLVDDQESIMHLSHLPEPGTVPSYEELRTAHLEFIQKDVENPILYLGNVVQVTGEVALQQEAYTYDPMQNTYFIVNE